MPKINLMLLILEVFQYPMSLALSMGYYHICISKNASSLCMPIIPWGGNIYKILSIGVSKSISQQK